MSKSVLLVTDIFGSCAGLQALVSRLTSAGAKVRLLDPYQGEVQHFADEAEAYACYSGHCGHDAYAALVAEVLTESYQLVLGFSAGATALWRSLDAVTAQQVSQAVLFYPGQIHQHLTLQPQIPVEVIFGHTEPHFAVADICAALQQKSGVKAFSTGYAHGFMNRASAAFDEVGYISYSDSLCRFLIQAAY